MRWAQSSHSNRVTSQAVLWVQDLELHGQLYLPYNYFSHAMLNSDIDCFAKARSEPERNYDLNIVRPSVRPSVSCETAHVHFKVN